MKKMLLITAGVAAVAATVIASMVVINKKKTQQVDTIDDTFECSGDCENCPRYDTCCDIEIEEVYVEGVTTEDETSEENTPDTSEDDTTDINDDNSDEDDPRTIYNRIMHNDSKVTEFLKVKMLASISEMESKDYKGKLNHPDSQAYYRYNSFANALAKLVSIRLNINMMHVNNESLLREEPIVGSIIETAARVFYLSEDGKNVVCDHDAHEKLLLLYSEFDKKFGYQHEVDHVLMYEEVAKDCIDGVNDIK